MKMLARTLVLLVAVTPLSGCSAVKAASDVARQYNELKPKIDKAIEDLSDTSAEFRDLNQRSFAEADKDKSGTLSLSELMSYLAMLTSGGVALVQKRLRKETDELWDKSAV